MPTLSIVIVSYNSRDLLGQCLKSVAEQTLVDHEVIVVDNASADGTPSLVAEGHPDVRLIANSDNLGFAAANNQGLKLASGRYKVLLNPDTLLRDGTLDRMVEYLDAHPEVGIVGARMVEADGSLRRYETWYPSLFSYLANPIMLRMWGDQGNSEVDFVSGSCLMIRQETMGQIGLLDERFFMYAEDADWCLRANRAGWKVYHCAEARLFHLAGGSSGRDAAARVVNIRQAKLYFFKKHYSWLSYWLLKVIVFCESLAKILFDSATYVWVGRERRKFKRSRMRGYALLIRSLPRSPMFIKPAG
jgi:GT2 family glycosyltransferase